MPRCPGQRRRERDSAGRPKVRCLHTESLSFLGGVRWRLVGEAAERRTPGAGDFRSVPRAGSRRPPDGPPATSLLASAHS